MNNRHNFDKKKHNEYSDLVKIVEETMNNYNKNYCNKNNSYTKKDFNNIYEINYFLKEGYNYLKKTINKEYNFWSEAAELIFHPKDDDDKEIRNLFLTLPAVGCFSLICGTGLGYSLINYPKETLGFLTAGLISTGYITYNCYKNRFYKKNSLEKKEKNKEKDFLNKKV